MDTDLVRLAQNGDKEAFTSLAAALADRFLAVSRRILRDLDLAEDATQQALLSIWRDLPQLRDPARFEAWSYRLLVRACYAESGRSRRWAPNIRLLPADEPIATDGISSVVDRDQLERGFRRLSLDHRTVVVLHHYLDLPLEVVAEIARYLTRDGCISTSLRDAWAARGARRRRSPDAAGGCAMSTDRDVTRTVRSWLKEDRHEDAARVLNLVLDEVDTTPQRRPLWLARRFPIMSTNAFRYGIAAAAVVMALAGFALLSRGQNVGDRATPSPAPTSTAVSTSTPPPLSAEVIRVSDFVVPFTYRTPVGMTGELEAYPGEDRIYRLDARTTGLGRLVVFPVGGFVHACAAMDGGFGKLPLGPDAFLEGLRDTAGAGIGPISPTTLGGLPAARAEVDPTQGACPTVSFHIDGLGLSSREREPSLAQPGRLIVAQAGSETIGVLISARTTDTLAEWLPIAQAYVDGFVFEGPS